MTTAVVVAPSFEPSRSGEVGDWRPGRYTDTLTGTDDFTSAADGLLVLVAMLWRTTEGPLTLDAWQIWLLRRVLETYPADWPVEHLRGRLRYKRVVISMGRQNGKSVLGALLAFFFLTRHVRGPKVGGFASIEAQAGIVYDRVRFAVEKCPEFAASLKATKTKGVELRDGSGIYETHPAKEASLQGEPFTAAIYDELHLGDMGLWDAIVLGQRSKPSAMLVGLTTAGDDASLLLKRLYGEGEEALDGRDERMGFFAWESVTTEFGKDYEPTEADVIAANPAVACGRIPLAEVMADTLRMWAAGPDENGITGRDRVIRYTMNRFTQGTADAWAPAAQFNRLTGDLSELDRSNPVFGVQRTETWEHAAITASWQRDGRLYSELVADLDRPDQETLLRACRDLATLGPCSFAIPANTLRPLVKALRDEGLDAWGLVVAEQQQAMATALGAVKAQTLTHGGDVLVRLQSSRAKARKTEDGARLSASLSIGDIDAVQAMHAGLFVASVRAETRAQLF